MIECYPTCIVTPNIAREKPSRTNILSVIRRDKFHRIFSKCSPSHCLNPKYTSEVYFRSSESDNLSSTIARWRIIKRYNSSISSSEKYSSLMSITIRTREENTVSNRVHKKRERDTNKKSYENSEKLVSKFLH